MPRYENLAYPCNEYYIYDGTLPGFYCAVYESVYAHEFPVEIVPANKALPNLFEQKHIPTNMQKAVRVRNSVREKISLRALELIETVFYSCMQKKELHILRFLLLGYAKGGGVTRMLSHEYVSPLLKAERRLWGEQHLLLGFIRFTDYGSMLAAAISPKNFVLPFLARHFIDRYSKENFIIYDKTHKAALLYENGNHSLVEMEDLIFDAPSKEEKAYRALWKRFYDTIAIEARHNPKCRMSHMPKRYWENMTEMQEGNTNILPPP